MTAVLLAVTPLLAPAPARSSLPPGYATALRSAAIPLEATAVVVRPVEGSGLAASLNPSVPMSPASTMKLLTTYVALRDLGPAYAWRTQAYVAGADLHVRGGGDPKLVVEQFWLFVQQIRAAGVDAIRGDLVLDKSLFAFEPFDEGEFDGAGTRAYNVGPDPLLLNFKAVSYTFVPDLSARVVRVRAVPRLAGAVVPSRVPAGDGVCGDWKARLRGNVSNVLAPQFPGAFPLACGERTWHASGRDHDEYVSRVFRAMWEEAGGTWTGRVRRGAVPPGARLVAEHESPPLSQVIRDVNKFSNNVMTRHLLLTLAAERFDPPASTPAGGRALREWLAAAGLALPGLVIENGSGLSRVERISADGLARVLEHAWRSPVMPEFVASLPLAGVDGTMRSRAAAEGAAHVKTGMLSNVRAIAGYIHARSGRRYVLVAVINHPAAGRAQAAHDALLAWVRDSG